MIEEELVRIHDIILKYFLTYKKEYPEFTFLTRMKNNNNRLDKGYLFQGNKDYIFVPLYRIGDAYNKTKTIGFVYTEKRQYIEIVFNKIQDATDLDKTFHEELVAYLKQMDKFEVKQKNDKQYFFFFKENDLEINLKFFLDKVYRKSYELLQKYDLLDKYTIDEETFNRNIKRIEKAKEKRNNMKSSIEDKYIDNDIKNIILYGAPGVGKTFNHKKLIALIEGNDFIQRDIFNFVINNKDDEIEEGSVEVLFNKVQDENRMKFITFHQSFGYEDFIEGFRPNEEGNIKLQEGIFKTICDDANKDRDKNYYLVIDEINRGNISKTFGELITLIEEDKRDTLEVMLPYSKQSFKIPSNLYIIGTMNSTDKSIALIDIALRRRFTFLKMKPKADLIDYLQAREIFEKLNHQITEDLGEEYQLGHSYFMKIQDGDDLDFVLEYKIIPLLEEYYYGDDRLTEVIKLCNQDNSMDSDAQ